MTFGRLVLFCCFIGACLARTEEIKKSFVDQAVECSKEISVSTDELQMIKNHQIPDNNNSKCLVKCVFQKKGMVDDKGMFDISSSIKMTENEFGDDKESIENSKKLYEICRRVNEEKLTDDDNGCQRAALLANCLLENAPKMGF